jgi:hypothetical protein
VFEATLEGVLLGAYEPAWPQSRAEPAPVLTLTTGAAPGGQAPPTGFAVHPRRFDRALTSGLVKAGRENKLSVTALLSGVFARVLRTRASADAGALACALGYPVDLRRRVTPPLAPDGQVCGLGLCSVTVDVRADDDPILVGRRFGADLQAALDRDEPQRALLAQRLDPFSPPPIMSTLISSIGVVDDPAPLDGASVRNIRFGTTCPGPVPALNISTVDGRLGVDLVYDRSHHDAEQAEQAMADFERLLAAIGRGKAAETALHS